MHFVSFLKILQKAISRSYRRACSKFVRWHKRAGFALDHGKREDVADLLIRTGKGAANFYGCTSVNALVFNRHTNFENPGVYS